MGTLFDLQLRADRRVGRTTGQRIAFGSSLLFYFIAAACGAMVFYYSPESGLDPVRASLLASIVFFGGAGFVLQIIGSARLKGILSGADDYIDSE